MTEAGACLLIVGAGYCGAAIAERALSFNPGSGNRPGTEDAGAGIHYREIVGTRTSEAGLTQLTSQGIDALVLDARQTDSASDERPDRAAVSPELQSVLERMTHLVICVAPSRERPLDDPVHRVLAPFLERKCPRWQWMGYLSTIGVYGDHQGHWIDEDTACQSKQARSILRREAELAWQASASGRGVPASILRLSGIYGPGRNMVQDALAGKGRRLVKKGQVFNRIHVDDIATATLMAAGLRYDGVLNITDDEPAPSHVVVEFAHQLVGREPPPIIEFEAADLSPMARSFYSENKRASNALSKQVLHLRYRYPTYREGLTAEAQRLGVAIGSTP